MSEIEELTLTRALDLMEKGECTSEMLVSELLRNIRNREDQLGAYVQLDEEAALTQARQADAARQAGESRSLLGIPLAVKDVINVAGQPCGCASSILRGYIAPYDATAIAKLRAAGAVFLGRTNMDEFAMGATTENSAVQVTRNPWDLRRVPGGSSGGSAAAVAGGLALASLGSDTGGSVRQPASFCGCVGLKPTYGRVSRYGLTAFASSLDQIGPITRGVREAALLLQAMGGPDPLDSTAADLPVPDLISSLEGGLKGLRLGLPREYFVEGMDRATETAVHEAIRHCEKLGAQIVDVSLAMTRFAVATYYIIACAEASANLARFDGVRYGRRAEDASDPLDMYCRTRAAGFGPEVKRRIILGTYVLSSGYYDAYYLRAQRVRALIRDDFAQVFQNCDALLAPVAPTPAFRLGEKTADPLQMYLGDIFTTPASLAGICAMSLPCGFTDDGLPLGLQIMGPAFREDIVLRVGYAYEQSTDWHLRRPNWQGAGQGGAT